jgi:DNA (cytosine-5)-methyltransferase 1
VLKVLDLFSGIGGFSLGLERTGGFETVAFCEIESYCRAVLKKHWPEVPCYEDVRTLTAAGLVADGIRADVICGGFPCQDISLAGQGAGLEGKRSGLWHEYARLIGEIKPKYALIENVSALRSRGLDTILGALDALGYDAEWHCIPAAAVGAPHERDRLWIIAHAKSNGCGQGRQGRFIDSLARVSNTPRWNPSNTDSESPLGSSIPWTECAAWPGEPALLGVDDGLPGRMDRVKALGNAVVPRVPEILGLSILAVEKENADEHMR